MSSIQPETLISVDMNFNNGSGHTASTVSILGGKSLSDNSSLGSLIGKQGSRSNFSDPKLQRIFKQFIEVERTTSQDSVKTQISRKYVDRTTLLLQSHFIAVRGRDIAPNGQFEYDNKLYEFAECADSPIKGTPRLGPQKNGAAIILGEIYNEITETDEITGFRASLIYKNGQVQDKLSYNSERTKPWYKNSPDISISKIKLGYTLEELKTGLQLAGITVSNMPNRDDILFDHSGTLESVLSAVASTLGQYWYVDPFTGTVSFISSGIAANANVFNPLTANTLEKQKYLDCSYIESALKPVTATTYWGTSGPNKTEETFESPNKERIARFRVVNALEELNLDIDKTVFSVYYGAFVASAFNNAVFDAITYYLLTDAGQKLKPKFGKYYTDEISDSKAKKWTDVWVDPDTARLAKEKYQGKFNLENGYFLQLTNQEGKRIATPSNSKLFKLLEAAYNILDNAIYVSNKYYKWKAQRMQMASSEANISGPFLNSTKLDQISATQSLAAILKELNVQDKTLEDLQNFAEVKGGGEYGFVGIKSVGSKRSAKSKKNDIYELFDEENFLIYETTYSVTYAAFSKELVNKLSNLITDSKTMFDERIGDETKDKTIKCTYTRLKRPTNEFDEDGEQERDDEDSEKTLDNSKITELFDKFENIKSSTKLNGASGNPLQPIQFELKTGKHVEVEALKNYGFSSMSSTKSNFYSSSRTLVGLHIPESFKITLSALSFKVGSQGITTTISESTMKLLSLDENLVIADGSKAILQKRISTRLNSRQRNFLGL